MPMDKKICFINSLSFQLEATARIFYSYAKNIFNTYAKSKITLEEYIILDTLIYYPHLNKSMLAKTLFREQCFIEKVLIELIKKKLIKEIKNNGTDIQVKYYELTKSGEKIYQDSSPRNDSMLAVLLKFISEKELLSFTKTLLKIRNIIISLDS